MRKNPQIDGRRQSESVRKKIAVGGCSQENVVVEDEDFVGVVV